MAGRTEPHWYVTEYGGSLRYRQRIHEKWLFLEVKPQASFPKEEGFGLTASLTVKLEVMFGEEYATEDGPEEREEK